MDTIANTPSYTTDCNMDKLGTYATEVELFASASFLNTCIWTFSPYGENSHRWQEFMPRNDLPSAFEQSEKCIYIRNLNEHFEPVTAM